MKILDLRKEDSMKRGYVEFEIEGEKFNVIFPFDDMRSPYYYAQALQNQTTSPTYAKSSTSGDLMEIAKREIANFLASKLFKDWEMLKNLKK